MENKQVLCDGCGFYKDEFFIHKHKSGKNYCGGCTLIVDRDPSSVRTITQEEFNKMLLIALKTPPLKLKDLKTRLKKERENKFTSSSPNKSKERSKRKRITSKSKTK